MKSLLIGDTSQVSRYFSNNVLKISSRNISAEIYDIFWDKVYILFAEQRTLYSNDLNYKDAFYNVNVNYTLEIINKLKCNNIIFLSTTELWNKCTGPINLNTQWNYIENYYTDSKRIITLELLKRQNVTICYPFNFNSIYRGKEFLFGKIYSSLKNKEKIKVGNLNLNREILHAKYVAKQISDTNKHCIIGSGSLTNIKSFIKDLYELCNLNFEELVEHENKSETKNSFYLSETTGYTYQQKLKDYLDDL